jgi:hypothetical protein
MQLSEEDADLFFNLMWSLQLYVNQDHQIYPQVSTFDAYTGMSTQDKKPVRDALYADIDIIDAFIADNPQNIPDDKLEIVAGWKQFIEGKFFIERLLKRYAVFIRDGQVYGVLGLFDPIEEVIAPHKPPLYVKTVLLPFKGQIIYDGLIASYGISFGGGVKRELKETYMTAKQNRRILTTLDPEKRQEEKEEREEAVKDYSDELEQLAGLARKLRGSSAAPAIHTPAFKLVRESIKFAQAAADDPKGIESLNERFDKVCSTLRKCGRVIDRTEVD